VLVGERTDDRPLEDDIFAALQVSTHELAVLADVINIV
jgi:hypothetical protein